MLETDIEITPPPSSPGVRLLLNLKRSGEPIKITISGKVDILVEDEKSLETLMDLVDRLDLIRVVRERVDDLKNGDKGVSLGEVKEEALRKYGRSI